jgi:hypothetical protein
MKQTSLTFFRTILTICLIGIIVLSCKKDEPFYQVDAFEMEIHHNVNKYRRSQGLSDLVFFHDLFVEARQQSTDWMNSGNYQQGLDERLDKIIEHWKPVNLDVLLSTINSKDTTAARIVVEGWIQDSISQSIITDDHIQSGPGVAVDGNGKVYITHFFMKIHD